MAAGSNLMETPLVLWVETFNEGKSLDYHDLFNGVFLNDVMYKIDPRPVYRNTNHKVEDVEGRLQNWDLLLRNVKAYYVEVLQQLLILKLPNIQLICSEPEKDISFLELKKALLLILGCAVQCERKEDFIEGIKCLDVDVQHAIVEHIKEITDDTECILPMEPSDQLETYTEKMFNHLTRVLRERDDFSDVANVLAQERDFFQAQVQEAATVAVAPTTSPEKQHLVVELAEAKTKMRSLRQEVEDKQEVTSDLRDEVEEQKAVIAKLKSENVELIQDSRSARSLRDELDILREKVGKVTDYECEINRLKSKLNELEFYKSRVNELREDNAILIETKNMLQEQLDNCHKRVESVISLENSLVKVRQQKEEMAKERDQDRDKIQLLTEENAHLQYEKKINMNESTNLEKELESARLRISGVGGSLSNQMNETTNAKILRLELENQHLKQKVEEAKETALIENTTLNLELEKENQRLAKKVEKLQESSQETSKFHLELEQELDHVIREKEQIVQTLETVKENAERQVKELERENENLSHTMENVRARSEQTNDARLKDLERENKKFHETVSAKNQLLSKFEFENRQLQKSYNKEQNDKDSLNHEIQQLKKSLEAQKTHRSQQEQMELDLLDLDNENQRIQKALEITTQRVQHLERDNTDLEMENEKFQKNIEALKFSEKKLLGVEKGSMEMESELAKLQKEKSTLEKEKKRLKQSMEFKDTEIDDLTTKCSRLEQEKRQFRLQVDKQKDVTSSVQEIEKENKQLFQQANVSKRTVATLREDLVNEKVKTQQLKNDLDRLTHDLERVGIHKEKLVMSPSEQSNDDSRYKALENMMEEALKKSMELKEEKIHALESRLEESKNRNIRLQEELRILKRECESLKQRYEEESHGRDKQENSLQRRGVHQNPTKEILELKDHLIEVERNNATLMAENKNMKSHTNNLNEQIKKLENQNSKFHSQSSSFQSQVNSLQTDKAKLQVENSTLQSQCGTFRNHLSSVENQLSQLQSEHNHLVQNYDELQNSHEQLVQDHEQLQRFHEQLTTEYEALISEHGSLKSNHKTLKIENKQLREQIDNMLQGKDDVRRMRSQMEQEKDQLRTELQSLGSVQMDFSHLRTEHDKLLINHEKLCKDYRDVLSDNKRLKTEYNNAQLSNSELQGQCVDRKDQLHSMDMEVNSLAHKYDSLYQMNLKMEEDNKNLLMQIQSLLNSNQDLLTQILNSKEHFAEEEKSYLEKMSDLRRQKERLEEKIMDHYKRQETHKKNRGLGARIAKKAAKIFVSKNQRSKSRTNLTTIDSSHDNTSLGSTGDTTDGQEKKSSDKKQGRRGSADNILDMPSLTKQSRSLAKSTNALNFSAANTTDGSLRGSKSRDNLLDSHGDKESLSSSNSTSRNSTSLLPGLGRPIDDDEGGFRSFTRSDDRSSPSNEMLTLEEFLGEANKKKKSADPKSQGDTDSKSSDNSENNLRRYQKRQAPDPPSYGSTFTHSNIPDVAAVSQLDLNMSRMSRISAGSSGSGQESKTDSYGQATPPYSKLPETSTPHNGPHRNGSLEELNQYSPFPRSHPSQDFRKNSLGSTPSTASRTLQYSFSSPGQQYPNSSGRSPNHNRELPPTPGENGSPAERLDRLMGMNSSQSSSYNNSALSNSTTSSFNNVSKNNNSYNAKNNDSNYTPDASQQGQRSRPLSARGSQSQSPSGVTRIQFRSQTPNMESRSWSPASQNKTQQYTPSQNGPDSRLPGGSQRESMTRHGPSPLTGGQSRPQSTYFEQSAGRNNSAGGYSSNENNKRTRNSGDYSQERNSVHTNGPVVSSGDYNSDYAHVQRPQSVPPSMFNSPPNSVQDQDGHIYSQPVKKVPPVPPPRRTREPTGMVTGRISLIREPGQGNTVAPVKAVSGRMPAEQYQSPGANTGHKQVPLAGGVARSQTPTARIVPSTKTTPNNAALRPMKPEETKDPKENALWGAR